jgi:RimJ/RimL family protein N-acetyltransferase
MSVIVETDRLILRPPQAEDHARWAEMNQDKETMRFIGGVSAPPQTWRMLRSMAGCWALDGFGMFSVIEKATGLWIGRLGPWMPFGWPGTEVGWGLTKDALGKGYATEGAAASIDWAIDNLGWTDIIHCIDPENTPSRRVAERLGSRNRGPGKLPDPYHEARIDIWGQSAAEWRARRRAG